MSLPIWIGFLIFIAILISLDLGVFNRNLHAPTIRESLIWTAIWVSLALAFNVLVYFIYEGYLPIAEGSTKQELSGKDAALQFLTSYLIEYSLSIDNIFVIALIIANFKVPPAFQHRLLFWGILGAAVFRGLLILGGTALLARFEWIIYLFGAFLLYSATRMMLSKNDEIEVNESWLVRNARRFYPISAEFDGAKFLTIENGRRAATPMALALLLIESSDVMFALDSIPAVFAVTLDPFIVFTSNIFAVLGLRTLYFTLAGLMDRFRYLKVSVFLLLYFIGFKMLVSHYIEISNVLSLFVIASILILGVILSWSCGKVDRKTVPVSVGHQNDDTYHETR